MAPTKRSNPYDNLLDYARSFKVEFLPIIAPYTEADEEPKTAHKKEPPTPINPFEPTTLDDFIGQEQAKEIIKIIVDSANKEKRLIPNIILTGAYGHGKTTLAKLIAKRHRKEIQIIDGSMAGVLVKPSRDKIYVIDEAHNIPAQVADSFNILIDSGNLRIIGCTTNPGALPAPFRSRFRVIYLDDYQPKDIARILEKASRRLPLNIDKLALNDIANRSKCNPRTALAILDFVREVSSLSSDDGKVTADVVLQSLIKLGIDEIGLTRVDKKYLDLLKPNHPVGLQYISATLSIDSETIQEEIEPYLLKLGLIQRTPRGRIKVDPDNPPFTKINYTDDMLEQLRQSLESM